MAATAHGTVISCSGPFYEDQDYSYFTHLILSYCLSYAQHLSFQLSKWYLCNTWSMQERTRQRSSEGKSVIVHMHLAKAPKMVAMLSAVGHSDAVLKKNRALPKKFNIFKCMCSML